MKLFRVKRGSAAAAAIALLVSGVATGADHPSAPVRPPASDYIALGRYVIKTTGCNDCHTSGYAASGGTLPEKEWLMGDPVGFRGPWGTTYAPNLRLYFDHLTEAQWMSLARVMQPRPPMPWFALRDMSDDDLRGIYRFIKAAGPAGRESPAYVPPSQTPKPPFVQYP